VSYVAGAAQEFDKMGWALPGSDQCIEVLSKFSLAAWEFHLSMIATARELLRRNLSPQSFQSINSCWRYGKFDFPRLVASVFVRRVPQVQGFPAGQAPGLLVRQLRSINVFAPTRMCRVMLRHGSDKGQGLGQGLHNYTTVYSVLFGKLRGKPLRIFELGLGTNNPDLLSSMGVYGRPGASLRGWRELFPHALVFGADIDRDILFEEDRIKTFYCDQLDRVAIRDLWAQPALQGGMDILIEDGLHTFEGNISFLEGSLEQLRPGGVYVVEDILQPTLGQWRERLETVYSKQYPNHEFALVTLPNSFNDLDNNLLIIRRRS